MREETEENELTTAAKQSQENRKRKKDYQGLRKEANAENEESQNSREKGPEEKQVEILATKPEELDKEIEEIARKIKDTNDKKMVQIKKHPTFHPTQTSQAKITDDILLEDWTSIQGQFGWTELSKTMIPYLTRSGNKYVCLRMADNKIFLQYRQLFSDEVWNCFHLEKLKITKAEAALLNEINMRHCDSFFGNVHFTINDTIATIDEVKELHEFLQFCFEKIVENSSAQHKKCGFIRIASQNCVPYVWYDNKQYVPLFYFEGECKYLEDRAVEIRGWEMAYIKVSCKIQGIRKALIDKDSIKMVEVDLVRKFFPPDAVFEWMWLTGCNVESLLRKPRLRLVPADVESLNKIPVQANQERVPRKRAVNAETQQRVPEIAPYPMAVSINGDKPPLYSATSTACLNPYVPTSTTSFPSSTAGPQHPNVVCVNNLAYPQVSSSSNVMGYKQTPNLRTVSIPNATRSRILQIADILCNNPNSYPYFLVKSNLEEKLLNCINMEPFTTTSLLITLEDLASIFFRVRLDALVNAVNVMRLDIFLPNKLQIRFLERCRKYPTIGLIKYKEFVDNIPQIRYILSSI